VPGRAAIGLLAATVVAFLILTMVDLPSRTPAAPLGQVSMQLTGTDAGATEIVNDWRDAGVVPWARASVAVDFVFILLYGSTLAVLGRRLSGRGWRVTGALAALSGVTAATCDLVEGVFLWRLIQDPAVGLAGPVRVIALTKFGLLFLSIAAVTIGMIAARRRSGRG